MNRVFENWRGVLAIYSSEMEHFRATILQNLMSPLITSALFLIAFGLTFDQRIGEVGGENYKDFLLPGLVLMAALNQAFTTSAWAIFTRRDKGTIGEILSAPISPAEMLAGFILPETVKAIIIAITITLGGMLLLRQPIAHPLLYLALIAITSLCFSCLGFLVGLIARYLQQMQALRMFVISPMVYFGGIFYEVNMLPAPWRQIAELDPVVYFASGMRYAMFGHSDQSLALGFAIVFIFIAILIAINLRLVARGFHLRP